MRGTEIAEVVPVRVQPPGPINDTRTCPRPPAGTWTASTAAGPTGDHFVVVAGPGPRPVPATHAPGAALQTTAIGPAATGCGRTRASACSSAAPAVPVELRVESLLARMNLEEKVGQLAQYAVDSLTGPASALRGRTESLVRDGQIGSLFNVHGVERVNALQRAAVEGSRLGIPLLIAYDTIHGYRTTFPVPLAMAASFSPEAVEQASAVASRESEAAGIRWVFAPMVDICRDPRWGRIVEGAGEDVYLGCVMAAAATRGVGSSVLSTAKHFAGYGAAEAGRDYNTVDLSDRQLRELYLPPFKAALDAGAQTVMAAFNDLNGTPCHASQRLLKDILRHEWGFDGIVVSDYNGVGELVTHGVARDDAEAARKALEAGIDMDMEGACYAEHLARDVRRGRVSVEAVDAAVRRILTAKFRLGLFDNPYADPKRAEEEILSESNRAVALDVARKSVVLLKNEGRTLPLSAEAKKIAVVGPLADSAADMLGPWCGQGRAEDVVSVLSGIRQRAGAQAESPPEVLYARGCEVDGGTSDGFAEAVAAASQSDVVVAVVGETAEMSGEAASRSCIDLPGRQQALLEALAATGKPLVVVLTNGRPLAIPWVDEHADAVLETWFLGTEAGTAIADVLFGDCNPSGKLPVSFPRNVGQVPIHYDARSTGRPPTDEKYSSKYLDVDNTPLYPFGFGLSYSSFELGHLRVSPSTVDPNGELTVQVDVTNTSDRVGEEVVQLYVRDLVASVTRPVKQLKGFRRVRVEPGQTQTVELRLRAQDLGLYGADGRYGVEPGRFQLWVGPSSVEGLEATFEVRQKSE